MVNHAKLRKEVNIMAAQQELLEKLGVVQLGERQIECLVALVDAYDKNNQERRSKVNSPASPETEDVPEWKRKAEERQKNIDAAFNAWRKQRLGKFECPENIDISYIDIKILSAKVLYARENDVVEALCAVYDYGVKRGNAFAKARAKKKAALHAANMKSGSDCSEVCTG